MQIETLDETLVATQLHNALHQGDLATAQCIVTKIGYAHRQVFEVPDEDGRTAMHLAGGSYQPVRLCLSSCGVVGICDCEC